MALIQHRQTENVIHVPEADGGRLLDRWPAIVGLAIALALVLGWQLVVHPTWTAPTRDPAWYTWRANVILQSSPGSLAREWGPSGVFAGGYRVTSPLAGAMLQRVAAAFTPPTTCVLFGLSLAALFGFHLLTSRFRIGEPLRSDGPMLWAIGLGMIFGLSLWLGIWGPAANFNEAAVPPPYTKAFFL